MLNAKSAVLALVYPSNQPDANLSIAFPASKANPCLWQPAILHHLQKQLFFTTANNALAHVFEKKGLIVA